MGGRERRSQEEYLSGTCPLVSQFHLLTNEPKKKSALNVVNSFVFNKEDVSEAVMTKPAFPPTFALRNVAQCTDLLGLP